MEPFVPQTWFYQRWKTEARTSEELPERRQEKSFSRETKRKKNRSQILRKKSCRICLIKECRTRPGELRTLICTSGERRRGLTKIKSEMQDENQDRSMGNGIGRAQREGQ